MKFTVNLKADKKEIRDAIKEHFTNNPPVLKEGVTLEEVIDWVAENEYAKQAVHQVVGEAYERLGHQIKFRDEKWMRTNYLQAPLAGKGNKFDLTLTTMNMIENIKTTHIPFELLQIAGAFAEGKDINSLTYGEFQKEGMDRDAYASIKALKQNGLAKVKEIGETITVEMPGFGKILKVEGIPSFTTVYAMNYKEDRPWPFYIIMVDNNSGTFLTIDCLTITPPLLKRLGDYLLENVEDAPKGK